MENEKYKLELTEKELDMLIRSVGFSVECTEATLRNHLEGGMIVDECVIPKYVYGEGRDYGILKRTLEVARHGF